MAISNPAQPSTAGLGTTTEESRGGLFTNTNGVGIDLSSIEGPSGADGRGIVSITPDPLNPNPGQPVTLTVLYTDNSSSQFVVPAGEDGVSPPAIVGGILSDTGQTLTFFFDDGSDLEINGQFRGQTGPQGISFQPVFFQVVEFDPNTGLPSRIDDQSTTLEINDTHYTIVSTTDASIFPDGTPSSIVLTRVINEVETGQLPFYPLAGMDGEHGDNIVVFYAESDTGTNPSSVYNNQDYITFVIYPAEDAAPTTPPVDATWVLIRGVDGVDGRTFVPIYYTENGGITNVSLTEEEVHTHVSYYRSDNPFNTLIFRNPAGGNTYDPDNPMLDPNAGQSLSNHLGPTATQRLGQHTLGATGPEGPQGQGIDTVSLIPDGNNMYHFDITVGTNTMSTDPFTAPAGPPGAQGDMGTMGLMGDPGTDGISIMSISHTGGTTPGEITTLVITLSNGQVFNFPVQPGTMGTAGTGTSTQFRGAGDISITTDPDGTVVITGDDDAQSIQGIDIVGTAPPAIPDMTPRLLEYDPVSSTWVYVPFPTGGVSANDSTISIVPGQHLTVGSNTQSPSNLPVRFTTNQSDNEEITVDLRTIATVEEFQQPATTQSIPATGQGTALVEAHVLRQAIEDAAAPSGSTLPAIADAETGDEFILIGQANPADNGFYYFDSTAWQKDNARINDQLGDWTITHDTDNPTSVNNTTRTINLGDDQNPLESLVHWDATTNYLNGQVVLYAPEGGSQEHILSIYEVINEGDTVVGTAPEASGGTSPGWRLVRSGIVAVETNDGNGAGGLTSNSTLHINRGTGVSVDRDVTTFTIGLTGTHHNSDVDDFGPGYAYSYFNLVDNTNHSGTVGGAHSTYSFDQVRRVGDNVYLQISSLGGATALPRGTSVGFTTTGGNDAAGSTARLFRNQNSDDRIVYAAQDQQPSLLLITQTDEAVNSIVDLQDLFDVPGGTLSRILNPPLNLQLLNLNEHHVTPADGTADWALNNNTDNIPTDKLAGLSAANVDPNTAFTINDQWLPTDLLRNVSQTDPTDTQILIYNEGQTEWQPQDFTPTLEGLTDTTITTPTTDQILRYDDTTDPDNPVWVNVDLPEMASGRIDFTQAGNAYVATGFIEDPTMPNVSTPIASAVIDAGNGSQLAFNLARAAALTLNVPDFNTLAWDQAFGTGNNPQTSVRATGSTDPLFPTQQLVDLFTNSGNVTIVPQTADPDPGPWTVSFTDPSLVQSPTTVNSLIGGVTTAIAFRATNNETGLEADDNGAVVRWQNASLNIVTDRFRVVTPFIETIEQYDFTFQVNNVSINNNARYQQISSTIQGGITTMVGSNTNVQGQAFATGAAQIPVIVTDAPAYYNNTTAGNNEPTDVIGVRFRRPAEVTGTASDFVVTAQTDTQPTWSYPLWWFTQASATAAPTTSATFLAGTRIQAANTSDSRPLGNLNITYTNSSGNNEHLYVAYPQGSPEVNNINVQTTISGATGPVQTLMVAANNKGTGINFENSAAPTPANTREVYNWFRLDVADGVTVAITNVNP